MPRPGFYASVQGHWIVCRCPYDSILEGHTEKELQVATAEMRKLAKRDRTGADLSAARLAAFIAEAHAHEDLMQQRLRDLEGKQVLEVIARLSPASVFTTILPSDPTRDLSPPPTEVATRLAPVDLTKLPVLGDYR